MFKCTWGKSHNTYKDKKVIKYMKSWVCIRELIYHHEDNHYSCVKSGASKIISNIFKVFSSFPQVLLADYSVHLITTE